MSQTKAMPSEPDLPGGLDDLSSRQHVRAMINTQITDALDRVHAQGARADTQIMEANWRMRALLPDASWTFPEVFERRAAQNPDHPALHVVSFIGREPRALSVSFGELSSRARKAATMLFTHGVRPRDRVIVSVANPTVFFAFLLGAQYLGAIPVPVPGAAELPPQGFGLRIRSVIGDARPYAFVLDDAQGLAAIDPPLLDDVQILDAAHLDHTSALSMAELSWRRQPHEIAFLQYTSGSTGDPKGVVVLHSNLTANLRAMIEAMQIGPADRIYSWLPLFHDMGLVAGLLMGIYAGIPAYVASPRHFVARPDSWLRGISRFACTFSPAPNFAFSLLARRVPDSALQGVDLRSWRLACDGAEPIDAETVRLFERRFAPFGLRQNVFRGVYGLAESTLAVSIPELHAPTSFDAIDRQLLADRGVAAVAGDDDPNAVTFVGVGRPVPRHSIRIVEPGADLELPERRLGEITVRGPSVTPWYFHELLAGAPPREVLHTGDLGYIANGLLYVVDRIKDILIIGGRKFSPHDIEHVVAGVPGVRHSAVAAFASRGRHGVDELVLALAPDSRTHVEPDALVRAVRLSVYSHFGLTPADILIVRPGDLQKTSSGKLSRVSCRRNYESGVRRSHADAVSAD